MRALKETYLTGYQVLNKILVPKLHYQFRAELAQTYKFETLMGEMDGQLVIDHAATRTCDPKVFETIKKIARVFELDPQDEYHFPGKKLNAIALKHPSDHGFKWFSTLVDVPKFSKTFQEAIEQDLVKSTNTLSETSDYLLSKLESERTLNYPEAEALVHDLFCTFFTRVGPPIEQDTIDAVQSASSETLNALLLGPSFNHIAYSVNHLKIDDWYGSDVIEVLYEYLKLNDFKLLDGIRGTHEDPVRQFATVANVKNFQVLDRNQGVVKKAFPARFLEFIVRKPLRNHLFKDSKLVYFQGFLEGNAEKIYEATKYQ